MFLLMQQSDYDSVECPYGVFCTLSIAYTAMLKVMEMKGDRCQGLLIYELKLDTIDMRGKCFNFETAQVELEL